MAEFFVPLAENRKHGEKVYSGIRKHVSEVMGGAVLSDKRIFRLQHTHTGNRYFAEVGETHALYRELVIAILYDESRDLYYVCTPNRGVVRGEPILVGADRVIDIVPFD